jgi:hypothetical protein
MIAKLIVDWLKSKIGDGWCDRPDQSLFIEHDMCGDTQSGFHPEYEIDWPAVEKAMDEWISRGCK